MLPQLLLTACLAITTLAKPLPASASTSLNIADIERRWAAGDSEVCKTSYPGCYVYAWWRRLCFGRDVCATSVASTYR